VHRAATERFALPDAYSRWGMRHTRNARDRIEEARHTLGLSVKYFEQFAAEEEALARSHLALADFHQVIDELWQPPTDDASARTKNTHRGRVAKLTDLYTANAAQLGTTGYAAERIITEYAVGDRVLVGRRDGRLRGY
jgi:hypothetical protein